VSQPTTPSGFDPRRLAGLMARPAPAPAPAPLDASVDEPAGGTGPTGHRQIEAVLGELERAEHLPPDQQIPVYESVHRTLQETLRSIEQN
jgi:hypothetical protein